MSVAVSDPDAIVKVSPAATAFDPPDSAPHHLRTGVPAESHSSTPVIVAAGMFVTVTAEFDAAVPVVVDAAANVNVGAPVPEV